MRVCDRLDGGLLGAPPALPPLPIRQPMRTLHTLTQVICFGEGVTTDIVGGVNRPALVFETANIG
jgi:hypothetical protein